MVIHRLGANNEPLTSANIHYLSGSPVKGDMDDDGYLTPADAAIILQLCADG